MKKLEQVRQVAFTVIGSLWVCTAAIPFSMACSSDSDPSRDSVENRSEREPANSEEAERTTPEGAEVSNREDTEPPALEEFDEGDDEGDVVEKDLPTQGGDPVGS